MAQVALRGPIPGNIQCGVNGTLDKLILLKMYLFIAEGLD